MAEPFYGTGGYATPGIPAVDPEEAAKKKAQLDMFMRNAKNMATVPFGGAPDTGPFVGPMPPDPQVQAREEAAKIDAQKETLLQKGPNTEPPPPTPHDTVQPKVTYGGGSAIRMPDGRTVLTNQQEAYFEAGGQADAGQMAEEHEGTTITHPDSVDFGQATTRGPGMGAFSPSQTDWSKVANPQGFQAFNEEPTQNILQKRAADLAKQKALTADPFAQERVEGEIKERIASAPQRTIAAADNQRRMQQQSEYNNITPQRAQEELMKDPTFAQLPDDLKRKAIQKKMAMMTEEVDKRFGKLTSRQDIF